MVLGSSHLAFDWQISPEQSLVPHLIAYQAQVLVAIRALFEAFAARIESFARSHAPWMDQTGAARQGLTAFVEGNAVTITLYLVTQVVYGLYLELGTRYMAPRPIVMPALQAHYAAIVNAIRALIGGGI